MARDPLPRWSLGELLDEVAAQTPAPGGGTSGAYACALAAALVEMGASFTLAREEYADAHARMAEIHDRASKLTDRALALAEHELYAYQPVLEALRLSRDDPDRATRVRAAKQDAARSPAALALTAAEVAELAAEVVASGNRNLAGDAITGALLAEAVAQAAVRLVEINLGEMLDAAGRAEAGEALERARAARERALEPAG